MKRLDLIGVYETFTPYEIIGLLYKFDKAREDFLEFLTVLHFNQSNDVEVRLMIERINDELNHVEHNIKVLKDAFMCHETKITETRNSKIIGVTKFTLN